MRKNHFTQVTKNLTIYRSENYFIGYKNNYMERLILMIMLQKLYILVISLIRSENNFVWTS